jgi:hypothetical protein
MKQFLIGRFDNLWRRRQKGDSDVFLKAFLLRVLLLFLLALFIHGIFTYIFFPKGHYFTILYTVDGNIRFRITLVELLDIIFVYLLPPLLVLLYLLAVLSYCWGREKGSLEGSDKSEPFRDMLDVEKLKNNSKAMAVLTAKGIKPEEFVAALREEIAFRAKLPNQKTKTLDEWLNT